MDQQDTARERDEKVKVAEIVYAPMPRTLYECPSAMTILVYDVCPEHGAHTDPDLQKWGYVENGI